MATIRTVEFIDDYDHKPVDVGDLNRVTLTFMGRSYELDLRTENLRALEHDLDKWMSAATPVGGQHARRRPSSSGRSSGTRSKAIRAWARENGYSVSLQGRIPSEVVAAFDKDQRTSP